MPSRILRSKPFTHDGEPSVFENTQYIEWSGETPAISVPPSKRPIAGAEVHETGPP
jgi:hypothetical protein